MNTRHPRADVIAYCVRVSPGCTAHALAPRVYGVKRPTWGRVYEAFKRAAKLGLIRAERLGGRTLYFPKDRP